MIASGFRGRRAERFAELLDEADRAYAVRPDGTSGARSHRARPKAGDDLTELVAVGRRLCDLPLNIEAQPEFRDGLRAMLMATIERDGIGATAVATEPEPTRRGPCSVLRLAGGRPATVRRARARGAIVVGFAAGTLALSGMSAASGDAIPGDALYSVKRSTERAQLALAGSDVSRGELYLQFARNRLDEAQAVRANPVGFSSVLDDMDTETLEGVRLLTTTAVERKDGSALDAIAGFAAAQREKLRQQFPGEAANRVDRSIQVLNDAERRAEELRKVLKCGTAAVQKRDNFGPVPKPSGCRSTGQRPSLPTGSDTEVGKSGGPGTPLPGPISGPAESAPTVGGGGGSRQPSSPAPSASSSSGAGLLGGVQDLVGGAVG